MINKYFLLYIDLVKKILKTQMVKLEIFNKSLKYMESKIVYVIELNVVVF